MYFLVLQGGRYSPKGRGSLGPDGIVWYSWKDSDYYSLRKVSMMIRPRNFRSHLSPWLGGVADHSQRAQCWCQQLRRWNVGDQRQKEPGTFRRPEIILVQYLRYSCYLTFCQFSVFWDLLMLHLLLKRTKRKAVEFWSWNIGHTGN